MLSELSESHLQAEIAPLLESTHATQSPEHAIFGSVLCHLVLLIGECRGVGVPLHLRTALGSIGPHLRSELESLHKQLHYVH